MARGARFVCEEWENTGGARVFSVYQVVKCYKLALICAREEAPAGARAASDNRSNELRRFMRAGAGVLVRGLRNGWRAAQQEMRLTVLGL